MKKWIQAFAVVLMLAASTTTASANTFYDVKPTHTHYASITWAVEQGILTGYPNGSFKPNSQLTEAQFLRIFARFMNPLIEQEVALAGTVEPVYRYMAARHVELAGTTKPQLRTQPITRLQVAKAFAAYDLEKVNVTTKEAIDWMYTYGVTTGKGISNDRYVDFGGDDLLQRGQIAAFFQRLYTKDVLQTAVGQSVYSAAKSFAPAHHELVALEQVRFTRSSQQDTYFVVYVEPDWPTLPYYGLLAYDRATGKWSAPLLTLEANASFLSFERIDVTATSAVANEVIVLPHMTDGVLHFSALGVDDTGTYQFTQFGYYDNATYKRAKNQLLIYEGKQLVDTYQWSDGQWLAQ